MDNTLPELTKLFRNAWARADQDPSSVMLEERTENFRKVRALFLNTVFISDWGTGYFKAIEAERIAGTALQKSGAFGVAESTVFSPVPEYLLDDSAGRIFVWVNTSVPKAGESRWDRILAEAREEAAMLEKARGTDDKDLLRFIAEKDVLRRKGRFPTFRTTNLQMHGSESAVNDLLVRLGIR